MVPTDLMVLSLLLSLRPRIRSARVDDALYVSLLAAASEESAVLRHDWYVEQLESKEQAWMVLEIGYTGVLVCSTTGLEFACRSMAYLVLTLCFAACGGRSAWWG